MKLLVVDSKSDGRFFAQGIADNFRELESLTRRGLQTPLGSEDMPAIRIGLQGAGFYSLDGARGIGIAADKVCIRPVTRSFGSVLEVSPRGTPDAGGQASRISAMETECTNEVDISRCDLRAISSVFRLAPFQRAGGVLRDLVIGADEASGFTEVARAKKTEFVVNEQGLATVDLRAEGDTDVNLLVTKASTDRVGIGVALPSQKFHVDGAANISLFTGMVRVGPAVSAVLQGDFSSGLIPGPRLYYDATSSILRMSTIAGLEQNAIRTESGGSTNWNAQLSNLDFRVSGDTVTSLIHVIAASDRVGIGTGSPDTLLDVRGVSSLRNDTNFSAEPLRVENRDTTVAVLHEVKGSFSFGRTADATARYAGGIRVTKEAEWTAVAATNDSKLELGVSLDGAETYNLALMAAGALRLGTATDATTLGSVVFGLTGAAARLFWDRVAATLTLVNAGTTRFTLSAATPSMLIDDDSTAGFFRLQNTVTGATGFTQQFRKTRAGGAACLANDIVGDTTYTFRNTTPADYLGGGIRGVASVVTAGTEDFLLQFFASSAGVLYRQMDIGSFGVVVDPTAVGVPLYNFAGFYDCGLVLRAATTGDLATGLIGGSNLFYDQSDAHLYNTFAATDTLVPGVFFTKTSTSTVANTIVETALLPTGKGTITIPAAYLRAGRTLRLYASGFYGTAAVPGTLTVRVRLGGIAGTVILTTGAQTPGALQTDQVWEIYVEITCRTAGVGGTVIAQGFWKHVAGTTTLLGWQMLNTVTVGLNTTVAQDLVLSAAWGTADLVNTISCTNGSVEGIGGNP